MNVDGIKSLPDKVQKLPEYVASVLMEAALLEARAKKLESDYTQLLLDRDRFVVRLYEHWSREELRKAGL